MLIVEPDALTIKFDTAAMSQADDPEPKTMTDAFVIVSVRALEFDDENVPTVNVLLFRSSAPFVSVKALVDPIVKAS